MATKEHSKNYEKVKRYHSMGIWSRKMLINAVDKGWITAEEFEQITGQSYQSGD